MIVTTFSCFTGEDLDDLGGVKGTVLKQSNSFTQMQPKKDRNIRPLPKDITFQKQEPAHKRRGGNHYFTCVWTSFEH